MEKITDRQYGTILLRNIDADKPEEWDLSGATHVRVCLPSEISILLWMQEKGFQFVDRMLNVTIPLKKVQIDLQKLIRLQPILVTDRKEEIQRLAEKCFLKDRRFQVEVTYQTEIAKEIIDGWVEEIPEFYVCIYREAIIGFLALKEAEDRTSASIHLAAVEEQYRASGAAISLYVKAIQVGIEKGYQNITGQISCCNTAVMNLYAYLGGIFSSPRDVYLKK